MKKNKSKFHEQRLPLGECPWCKEHLAQLTPEQRKAHDEALEYFRRNLCPGDPRHYDPFPEKEPD